MSPNQIMNASSNQFASATSSSTSQNGILKVARHRKNLKCAICSKQINSHQSMAYHMKSHTNERPHKCEPCEKFFKCLHCPASFVTSSNMIRHTRLMHEKDPRMRRNCEICHKTLSIFYMSAHMKWHANIMPYSCIMCGKRFYTKGNLASHIREKHLMERPYSCQECPATFPLRFRMTDHFLRVHKPEEWYTKQCVVCNKMLQSNSALNLHMASHTGEKHYKCVTCGKRLRSPLALKKHNEGAHGEENQGMGQEATKQAKSFCIMCDKGFPGNGGLNMHMFVHTRERPFWCEQCPSSYCKGYKLKMHIKTTHAK